MNLLERLLIIVRNFAIAHFFSGWFLFLLGWLWGLNAIVLIGVPCIAYFSAFWVSRDTIQYTFQSDWKWIWNDLPKVPLVLIGCFLLLNTLFCLLPPASHFETDAMVYHLSIPWQYYLRGGVKFLDWSVADKYPLYLQLAQLPFTILTFPWIIKIWNIFVVPALWLMTAGWLRLFGISRNQTIWIVALVSGLVLFGVQYGTAMFDLMNALYALLGFFFLVQAVLSKKRSDLFLGALILGMACAAKMFLVYFAMAWGFSYLAWKTFFKKGRWTFFDGGLFVAPLLFGSFFLVPVWIRNMIYMGNPFFPMFLKWLGPVIENEGLYVVLKNIVTQHGYGSSLFDFLLAPFRLVLPVPRRFDYWSDPILLIFFAGSLFQSLKEGRTISGLVGLICFFLFGAFFYSTQEARYLYPFWILVVALGSSFVVRHVRYPILKTVIVLQCFIGFGFFAYSHRNAIYPLRYGLKNYLSHAAASYSWNQSLKEKHVHQLCLRNIAGNHVWEILYFDVPVKWIQHFSSTMSLKNPLATEGCDAFAIGDQNYGYSENLPMSKPQLVTKEIFLKPLSL